MRKNIIYSLLAAAVIILAMPHGVKFNFEYTRGSVWNYETLFAKFDFPLLKTEEQMLRDKAEASSSKILCFRNNPEAVRNSLNALMSLSLGEFSSAAASELEAIYECGVIPDASAASLRENGESVVYVQKGKRAQRYPSSELYSLSEARQHMVERLSVIFPSTDVDSLLKAEDFSSVIFPNLVFDAKATDSVKAGSDRSVSPTSGYVSAGQLIVSQGEMITDEIAVMLDSYKAEYNSTMGFDSHGSNRLLGGSLLIIGMMALLWISVHITSPSIFSDNRFLYLLTIFTLTSVSTFLMLRFRENAVLSFPFTLSALFLQAFFKNKLILPVYFISLMPLLLYADSGYALYSMFLIAGVVGVLAFRNFNKGWRQFITAFITYLVLVSLRCAFYLSGMMRGDLLLDISYLFLASFLTVAGYPLVYLFELIFNLVSSSRLSDLSDTSNKLLRELEHKAPGTFQHSLQVMNMATSAARSIGAYELLVRAGALYHDIGKMVNPICFVENESLLAKEGDNRHHGSQTPVESAREIIRHVTDGVEIARRNRIPSAVVDFILSHHGTTKVSFFYNKFIDGGGDPSLVSEFTYPGIKPRTREQIILMLCDSIEAGARTLKDKTPAAYSEFVDKIVDSKIAEGQFEESDISIREIGIIKKDIKAYLGQIYHERVEYPSPQNRIKLFKRYENRKQKN